MNLCVCVLVCVCVCARARVRLCVCVCGHRYLDSVMIEKRRNLHCLERGIYGSRTCVCLVKK
jgi:hypothetical protein